jgi:hypothetical protein
VVALVVMRDLVDSVDFQDHLDHSHHNHDSHRDSVDLVLDVDVDVDMDVDLVDHTVEVHVMKNASATRKERRNVMTNQIQQNLQLIETHL